MSCVVGCKVTRLTGSCFLDCNQANLCLVRSLLSVVLLPIWTANCRVAPLFERETTRNVWHIEHALQLTNGEASDI